VIAEQSGIKPAISRSFVQHPTYYATTMLLQFLKGKTLFNIVHHSIQGLVFALQKTEDFW